jgi:8-hydroxy-5-deazaflavin:NADPH oxidoreductase
MKVTVIGAGNMGRGIGTRAVAGGSEVEIVDRDPAEARALADELSGAAADGGSATAVEPGGRLRGEIVVLAVYYPSVAEAIEQYRDQLAGKVVVEISLPLDWETFDRLLVPAESSAAEEAAKLVPAGTPVVKAFTTNFARTLAAGNVAGQRLDVLIAGDDEAAKAKVAALAEGGGLRPLDVGALRRARQIEHAGFLHAALQEAMGSGYLSALKFLPDAGAS